MASRAVSSVAKGTRIPSAIRHLARNGVEALKPQLVLSAATTSTTSGNGIESIDAGTPISPVNDDSFRRTWHKPKISRRKAHVLRKQAIREGTYGTFDGVNIGWDPAWDAEFLKPASSAPTQGRYRLTVPKQTSRQRTREQRAQKIERNMEGMDERIEAYHVAKHEAKPADTFENLHKKLMRVKK